MSGASSNAVEWFTRLDPCPYPTDLPGRPDDPRLGSRVEFWRGGEPTLWPGRPILLGFPQDEGVRRNNGRPGAAEAPRAVRHWLYRLTPFDSISVAGRGDGGRLKLLDLGNLRLEGGLENSQTALGEVIAALLAVGAIPLVLGGGHETAYGHFLGYARDHRPVGIINLDAHLDVRPVREGRGHSGTPFRQALEHPESPLGTGSYVCLGAQPFAVSQAHADYVRERGGHVHWAAAVRRHLADHFSRERDRLAADGCPVYVTLDADVVRAADVPGVSAPNPLGLDGVEVCDVLSLAGASPAVSSLDLVEINPSFDHDGQSARWAALALWHFLAGLGARPSQK